MNKSIIILFLVLLGKLLHAQNDKLQMVYNVIQSGDVSKAKDMIDSVALHPETKNDPMTWYYRGFVYKDIYKKQETANPNSPSRMKALSYFKQAVSLDKEKKLTDPCKSNIKFLATTFFNDAAAHLNTENYELSIKNYDLYKSSMKFSDSTTIFKQRDIEFFLALASVYTKISEANADKKKEFFLKSRYLYDRVLAMDPDNLGANYNLGILYYNRAVDIINTSNYDVDLVALSQLQDTCINLFRTSLPFMEHAYRLDPANKYVLIGLSGIYFSLNEKDKSEKYKKELELIDKDQK